MKCSDLLIKEDIIHIWAYRTQNGFYSLFFFLSDTLTYGPMGKMEMLFLLCKALRNFGASNRNKPHTKSLVKWHL